MENGVEIVNITPEDRATLQQAATKTYEQLESMNIDPVLVKAIIAQGNKNVH